MEKAWHRVFCLCVAVLLCEDPLPAFADAFADKYIGEVYRAFDDIGARHKLTMDQKEQLIFDSFAKMPAFSRKGGVGIVGGETFIILDEKQNELLVAGKHWQGKSSNQEEVVFLDTNNVLRSDDHFSPDELTIVIFTPSEARFVSYAYKSAGVYRRFH